MFKAISTLCTVMAFASCSTRPEMKTVTPADFIPRDSANKMILSYQASLDSSADSNLSSLIIDMEQLRIYDDSSTGPNKIKKVKIMLAHTLDYINSGHKNQPAGYKIGALTVVLAGVNAEGNYVYFKDSKVLNHSTPCPYNCPPGNAAGPILTQ